jgi:hypothetical protein
MKARTLRLLLNLYPPFLGAGVHVRTLSEDYREACVELRQRWYNRNFFGDHFGGSLYAMTDPFYALMLIHVLGGKYRVTHAAGGIEYLAPARGVVTARFRISDEHVAAIKAAAENGEKHLPQYATDIVDRSGKTVARVTHTAYVRKKGRY